MTTETTRNKTVVHRLFADVWNQGDMAAAAEILANPEGVQRYVTEFRAAFTDLHHEVQQMVAEGDTVAVVWSAHATHTGTWLGLPATGKTVDWSGITLAHLVDGLIVDHDTRWDMVALAVQLGTIPAGTWLPIRA